MTRPDSRRTRRTLLAASGAALLPLQAARADDRGQPHSHVFTAAAADVLTVVGPWEMC